MSHALSATAQNSRPLKIAFLLTFTYFIVEVIGGLTTGSLALLADAAHMLTDVGGLGLALFAGWMSRRAAGPSRTYGYYRIEILAAAANAIVLFVISFWILFEAWQRFQAPPSVSSVPMMAIAAVGLIVNLVSMRLLAAGAGSSLNVRGAYLEVISDMLGSIGVLIAGAIMLTTGWYYADPLFSVAIGLFILPRTWKLFSEAMHVLLEGTPANLDVAAVQKTLLAIPGVGAVHDLHVWTITSGLDALSAHLVLLPGKSLEEGWSITQQARQRLHDEFKIGHATLQIEPPESPVEEGAF